MTHSDRFIGIAILLTSTVSEAVGQFAFKRASSRGPVTAAGPQLGPFGAIRANFRWIVFGWLSFVLDGFLWSAAHPIGSIVFVVVAILSKLFLKEQISPRRWIGIGLVLSGAAVVAFN